MFITRNCYSLSKKPLLFLNHNNTSNILIKNYLYHGVSSTSKQLFNRFNNNNKLYKIKNSINCGSNKSDSILSTYASLFVRRNRFSANSTRRGGKINEQDLKKVKVDINGVRRLLSLAKPEKYKLAVALVLLLISSSVTMVVPFFIGKLIDFIQTGDKESMKDNLKMISLGMALIFVVGALANFGRVYIIQSTGQRIVMRLRQSLFKSVMSQEMAFFDKNKTGELINRLSSDTEVIGMSISQNLSDGLRSIMQASFGVGMMLYVSPHLGKFETFLIKIQKYKIYSTIY